ncbi:acetylornithine deacetylase/succinyl-diaminopimelate desuccinylase-like protein [Prauserella isguenensis]|uniref:Acetylornithine deacetylase/succinyl-diaminopimelate desuccinylase-like protein n=1 Tax=Prauserella isguenensis TaxID=1470180 RepID=A0A839S914_9PSEU|nr:M20/M25/M40 family metallo-hydrolase [Prauserella isguenensis]MBB3053117.1 acetylornithine deacetylase/succinyl-diaminopimelate desuccinylase-like protein [Prauserella isguenensis]
MTLPVVERLEALWASRGVETQRFPTPKEGNTHLRVRIPGRTSTPGLMFLCHTDVVDVQPGWTTEPFAAGRHDGFLRGRGVLDMKGMLAAVTTACLRLVDEGAVPDRDIVVLYDCDEEGGWHGTSWLLKQHPELVNIGAVVTEGGWALCGTDGRTPMIASMSCAERTFGALRVTTTAAATHSSRPVPRSAIGSLAHLIARLERLDLPVRLVSLNRTYFERLREATDDPALAGAVEQLLAAHTQPALDAAGDHVLATSGNPALHNALLRSTLAFVVAEGGKRANAVPSTASVLLQLRFTPGGSSPQEVIDLVRECVGADGQISVVGPPWENERETLQRWQRDWTAPHAPAEHEVFEAWEHAVAEVHPGVATAPVVFEGGTSAKPWREKGIPVYGLYPYFVDDETLTAMHGADERIRIDELRHSEELFRHMLLRFCT